MLPNKLMDHQLNNYVALQSGCCSNSSWLIPLKWVRGRCRFPFKSPAKRNQCWDYASWPTCCRMLATKRSFYDSICPRSTLSSFSTLFHDFSDTYFVAGWRIVFWIEPRFENGWIASRNDRWRGSVLIHGCCRLCENCGYIN